MTAAHSPTMSDVLHRPWAYVAWLIDLEPRLDTPQAEETPRILLIEAPSAEEARQWGDELVLRALRDHPRLVFVRSTSHSIGDQAHADDVSWSTTPRCRLGEELDGERILADPRG